MKYNKDLLASDLATKLKLHLKKNNLETSSREIGTSKATLSRVLNGGMPELLTYARICKFMGKSMDEYILK